MALLADIMLASGALLAALYCLILSRRLRKFTDLESGIGSAVKMLSVKADALERSVKAAQASALQSVKTLDEVSDRAEAAARHLELLVASLHSLPDVPQTRPPQPNPFQARRPAPNGEARS